MHILNINFKKKLFINFIINKIFLKFSIKDFYYNYFWNNGCRFIERLYNWETLIETSQHY